MSQRREPFSERLAKITPTEVLVSSSELKKNAGARPKGQSEKPLNHFGLP